MKDIMVTIDPNQWSFWTASYDAPAVLLFIAIALTCGAIIGIAFNQRSNIS